MAKYIEVMIISPESLEPTIHQIPFIGIDEGLIEGLDEYDRTVDKGCSIELQDYILASLRHRYKKYVVKFFELNKFTMDRILIGRYIIFHTKSYKK